MTSFTLAFVLIQNSVRSFGLRVPHELPLFPSYSCGTAEKYGFTGSLQPPLVDIVGSHQSPTVETLDPHGRPLLLRLVIRNAMLCVCTLEYAIQAESTWEPRGCLQVSMSVAGGPSVVVLKGAWFLTWNSTTAEQCFASTAPTGTIFGPYIKKWCTTTTEKTRLLLSSGGVVIERAWPQRTKYMLPRSRAMPRWASFKDGLEPNHALTYHRSYYHTGYANADDVCFERLRGYSTPASRFIDPFKQGDDVWLGHIARGLPIDNRPHGTPPDVLDGPMQLVLELPTFHSKKTKWGTDEGEENRSFAVVVEGLRSWFDLPSRPAADLRIHPIPVGVDYNCDTGSLSAPLSAKWEDQDSRIIRLPPESRSLQRQYLKALASNTLQNPIDPTIDPEFEGSGSQSSARRILYI